MQEYPGAGATHADRVFLRGRIRVRPRRCCYAAMFTHRKRSMIPPALVSCHLIFLECGPWECTVCIRRSGALLAKCADH